MKVGGYGLDMMSLARQQIAAARRSALTEGRMQVEGKGAPAAVDPQKALQSTGALDAPTKAVEDSFSHILTKAVGNDASARQAVDNYVRGDAPLHETMVAVTKADISLRLLVNVRNKLLDAYRQVMRMS